MGNFRSDRRDSRDRGFGGNRSSRGSGGFGGGRRPEGRGSFRDRDSGSFERRRPVEMHEVTCDKCGKRCEVPFKPTSDKPVFCSDCFRKEGSSNFNSRPRENSFSPSASPGISQAQYKELNAKLDKILGILNEITEEVEEGEEDEGEEDEEVEDDSEEEVEVKKKK